MLRRLIACSSLVLLVVLSTFDGLSTAFHPAQIAGKPSTKSTPDWLQFCGSPARNNVTFAQNIPMSWDIESQSNIKWMAKLGSQSYGSPVIANGKVVIGTNNGAGYLERLPNSIDLGCLLCFRESDGQFLWQHSSKKLPTGRLHDRPLQGVCSTPIVEGDRLWYVTNRGEIVCLDTEGFYDDEDDGPVLGAGSRLFEVSPSLDVLARADTSPADQRLVQETIRSLLLSKQLPIPQPFGIRRSHERNEWIVKTVCREQKEFYRMTLEGLQLRVFNLAERPQELLSVKANLLEGLDEGHLSDSLRHQFQAHGVRLTDDLQVKVVEPSQSWEVMMTGGDTITSFNLSIESGRLSCFQKVTSDLKREADVVWSFDMMIELGVQQHEMANCSPTIWGDVLFVCTSNGVDESHISVPAPEAPSFLALHKKTGKVLWTDNSPGENILHGQWSSPAVAVIDGVAQVIFAGGDGWLYSFRADRWQEGKPELLWKFDCNPKESQWILGKRGTRNSIVATPVIYEGRVYVAVGQDPEHGEGEGCLWCVDPTKRGDISAQLVVDAQGQPMPHRRTNVINTKTGERVIANPNSGVVWSYRRFDTNQDGQINLTETMHRSLAGPAIKEDLLFIVDLSGIVHCLDAKTGEVHWTCDLLATSWAVPLIVGDRVFVVDEDGDVAIFELSASPEKSLKAERTKGGIKYNVPKTIIRMDSSIYSTPAVANEVLYLSTRNRLYAIGAKNK